MLSAYHPETIGVAEHTKQNSKPNAMLLCK